MKTENWSLGCQQLTSSSCDVRVHFRVARQCYFKCKSNAVGHFHVLFKLKCVSLRLFTVKTVRTKKWLVVSAFYINWWAKINFSFSISFYSPGNEWWRGGSAQCHWYFFNNRTISRMLISRELWSIRVQTMEMMWWWLHTAVKLFAHDSWLHLSFEYFDIISMVNKSIGIIVVYLLNGT